MTSKVLTQKAVASVIERVKMLETELMKRQLIPEGFYEEFTHKVEEDWNPRNGAAVIARAWTDQAFMERLMQDGKSAIEEMGYSLPAHHRQVIFLRNSRDVHNVIVCTLCSCNAFTLIGIAPSWYKDLQYRSRIVREARTVLGELGLTLPESTEIRVWDTNADTRYVVMPVRPARTENWSAKQLAALVTKESMIGSAQLPSSA